MENIHATDRVIEPGKVILSIGFVSTILFMGVHPIVAALVGSALYAVLDTVDGVIRNEPA